MTSALPLLVLVAGIGLAPRFAYADVVVAAISDLTENPITVTVSNTLNAGENRTITAANATPEMVSFMFSLDGTVMVSTESAPMVTGMAVMKDPGADVVSDILQVTLTQMTRGNNIAFIRFSGTFTSDSDNPSGLSLDGFGLSNDLKTKLLAVGVTEDGTQQTLTLICTANCPMANGIDTTGLMIEMPFMTNPATGMMERTSFTAASDVEPEPSFFVPLGGLLLALVFAFRRRAGVHQAH